MRAEINLSLLTSALKKEKELELLVP
jgi:hypothetical protein